MLAYREYKDSSLVTRYQVGTAKCAECGHPVDGYFCDGKLMKVEPCPACRTQPISGLSEVSITPEKIKQWVMGEQPFAAPSFELSFSNFEELHS